VDHLDDLLRIDPLEVDRRDPEVRMPELPLGIGSRIPSCAISIA
jgi:hypothetical protein